MHKLEHREYNTIHGIESCLKSYRRFHAMLHARKEAHQRDEHLDPFIVLGAFSLDTFGQVGKLSPSPKGKISSIPSVMETDAFYRFITGSDICEEGISTILSPVYLPPLNIKCAHCEKYYDIDDCHDVIVATTQSEIFPLTQFVGKQLWEVRRHLGNDHTLERVIHPDAVIRNDRFIDLRDIPYSGQNNYPLNRRGWVGQEDGLSDWYTIQPGDETAFETIKYFHAECFKPWMTEKTTGEFRDLLSKVGFEKFAMEVTENKYGSFQYRGPWFNVMTPKGGFTIGWRKRVIEIRLHGWNVDCNALFLGENVTTSNQLVHAYSVEKAIEYLQTILAKTKE